MLSTYGLQRHTPDAIRGRVFSFDYGLVTLTIALSTLLAGILTELLTPQAAVWTMVALLAVAGLGWFWFSTPARRRASREPDSPVADAQPT
jgi:MFS family permease